MLHEAIHPFGLSGFQLLCCHTSAKYRVFREILEITACKRGPVRIHRRGIPAGYMHLPAHLPNQVAVPLCKAFVESIGYCRRSGKPDRPYLGKVVIQRCRAVNIALARLADRRDFCIVIACHGDELVHLVHSQVIKKFVPQRVII